MLGRFLNKSLLSVAIIFISSCAHSNNTDKHAANGKYIKSSGILLTDKIEENLAINESNKHHRVQDKVQYFRQNPSIFTHLDNERVLILNYILSELEKREMPAELAMIPLIESSYRPSASNRGQHVGLWQLGAPTAKTFGVAVNGRFDGRYNVENSTQAALDYLEYLNNRFDGDWLLTMAAFNAGEGRVLNSIKRNERLGKPTDYWNLSLPNITQEYIPKVLALSELSKKEDRLQRVVDDLPKLITYNVGSQQDLLKKMKPVNNVDNAIQFYNPTRSIDQRIGFKVIIPEDLVATDKADKKPKQNLHDEQFESQNKATLKEIDKS